ncbi:MAG: galactosyldiacylglycerol synthase [Gemmatimonadota bacterium]
MITLIDTATNAAVGSITEAELHYLVENLEEDSLEDTDYYFSQDTIDLLTADGGATDHLLAVLREALGDAEGVELRWEKH